MKHLAGDKPFLIEASKANKKDRVYVRSVQITQDSKTRHPRSMYGVNGFLCTNRTGFYVLFGRILSLNFCN